MRFVVAGAVITAALAACSRPSDVAEAPAQDEAAAPDLALSVAAEEAAVASELEAPRPPETRPAAAARFVAHRPAAPAPIGAPALAAHDDVEPLSAPEPTRSTHPRVDDDEQPAARPSHVANAGGGKPRVPVTEGAGRVPDVGYGPAIVRGGAGTVDDDCARHRPPQAGDVRPNSGAGVLINDRTPRRGPPQTGDRMPAPTGDRGPGGIRLR